MISTLTAVMIIVSNVETQRDRIVVYVELVLSQKDKERVPIYLITSESITFAWD